MSKSVPLNILLLFPFFLSNPFSLKIFDEKAVNEEVTESYSHLSPHLSSTVLNPSLMCASLDFNSVTSRCQPGGTELVTATGMLKGSGAPIQDNFVVYLVYDENHDGVLQAGEPIVHSIPVSGQVSSILSLPFSSEFLLNSEQACHILAALTATNSDICVPEYIPMPVPHLLNAGDDQLFCSLSGTELQTVIGDANCTSSTNQYSWSALPPANISDLSDPASPNPLLSVNWAGLLGETLIYVLETQRSSCGISSFDTVSVKLPETAFGYFSETYINIPAPTCQSTINFCLGIPGASLPGLEIRENGILFSGTYIPCNGTELAIPLSVGLHELTIDEIATGCSDTVLVNVACPQSDSLIVELLLHQQDTICLNTEELAGGVVSVSTLCPGSNVADFEIVNDSCVAVTANFVGETQACFVACDGGGICDTTYFLTSIIHPFEGGLRDTLIVSQNGQFCFDESMLNLSGPIAEIENLCPTTVGSAVGFGVDTMSNCLAFHGFSVGEDSACMRLCDALGNCDTVQVYISVVPGAVVFDTLFVGVDSGIFCASGLLPGSNLELTDLCPTNYGESVLFEINGECLEYFGASVGQDTFCLRLENEFGEVAIYYLDVSVITTESTVFCDSVFIGESHEICLDTTELPGQYDHFEILEDGIYQRVDFLIDPIDLCVRYDGVVLGQDSFVVAVCDDLGVCDTTVLCVTVAPYFERPGLTNDTTTAVKETPIVIDPIANDTVFGDVTDYFILDPPISGNAVLNLDGSVSYVPDPPFCARWDQFNYVICNANGCDTAAVNIYIECVELTIFNAVSPNNDNVNDYFYIAKIENFPNNRLWIYNRWGSLVFDTGGAGYKNNWPGTWGDEIDLPDGTYYYILEWDDNDVRTVQRGYFEMFR